MGCHLSTSAMIQDDQVGPAEIDHAQPLPENRVMALPLVESSQSVAIDAFGRCGPGDASFSPDYGYTQNCFNHDLCVRQLKTLPGLWPPWFTFSDEGPCGDEFAKAIQDYTWADDCTF